MSISTYAENIRHLYYLGLFESSAVDKDHIGFAGGDKTVERRSNDERLIEHIENAQLNGDLPIDAKDCQQVAVSVSKHGLKVLIINYKV
uniref:Alpha-galactosidase n=1 Tax=Ascaris lumbricoides TaxID=6252 RepID=A0A0M3IM54_ASCLU